MIGTAFAIIVFSSVLAIVSCRGLSRLETKYALISFALHIAGAVAQWALTEFYFEGGGDVVGYLEEGNQFARYLDYDFTQAAPEVLKFALQLDAHLPFRDYFSGGPAGTMCAISGLFIFIVGPSLLPLCLMTSWIGWLGPLCLYRVAREEVADGEKTAALVGVLLVPSVVFWSGGFVKETFAMSAFGVLALSMYRVLRSGRLVYVPLVVVGGLGVALIKPYILIPFVFATAAWIYADRAWRTSATFRIRPAYLILAGALAVGGVAAMGNLFPEFSADRLADNLAERQEGWQAEATGSTIAFGSGQARTLPQQLVFVPLALVNALFRPAVFDARTVLQALAALETTAFAVGVLSLFGNHARRIAGVVIRGSPPLVFCIVFVATFGVAVGLATSNLGSLSRYRIPMMPFYATALLVLRKKAKAHAAAAATQAAATTKLLMAPQRSRTQAT